MYMKCATRNGVTVMGPILYPAQLTFYTDAWVAASWQLVKSVLFPPHACKLGNDLALQGAVWRKEEACSGAHVPRCYFAVSENNCATNQEISRKSVARCSDAILRAHT